VQRGFLIFGEASVKEGLKTLCLSRNDAKNQKDIATTFMETL